jgi:hypothetical protein
MSWAFDWPNKRVLLGLNRDTLRSVSDGLKRDSAVIWPQRASLQRNRDDISLQRAHLQRDSDDI